MQLYIVLLTFAAAAAVAKPILPVQDDALPSTQHEAVLSERGKYSCDQKRKWDSNCSCDLLNPFKYLWCAMMPSCKECGIPCKQCSR